MHDDLNAFVPHDPVTIDGAATGPLAGLRFAVKDVFDIAGHVTGAGSPDWFRTHPAATVTAPAVVKLIDAGATLVGKTICDELTFGLDGVNVHYGTPRNPAAPGRVAGGSSCGSAAVTAAGLVDFALGTDTGGSVRVPASYCGIFGIRPTHGRVDNAGVFPLAPAFDTVGWMARDPDVLARVGDVLLDRGLGGSDPGELLVPNDALAVADDQVQSRFSAELHRVAEALGFTVKSLTLAADGLPAWRRCFSALQLREAGTLYADWIARARPDLGPGVRERLQKACASRAADVDEALVQRAAISEQLAEQLAGGSVLCLPAAPTTAPRLDLAPDENDRLRARILSLTCIAGLGGLPQVAIPIPSSAPTDRPVGLSLIAGLGGDERLLALAARITARS